MSAIDNSSRKSVPRSPRRALATLRSTSGAGFQFEDLIAAWQLVKALSGEQAPAVGGVGTQLQAQVSTLGWRIDDLLLTSEANGSPRRLAISAKGNQQVSASGLPSDFVARAWEQWRDPQGPFNHAADGLMLVTLGTLQTFDAAWREVKNACSGLDAALTMSRIRSNRRQSRIFDSVQKPRELRSQLMRRRSHSFVACTCCQQTCSSPIRTPRTKPSGNVAACWCLESPPKPKRSGRASSSSRRTCASGGAPSRFRNSGPFYAASSRCGSIRISSRIGRRSPTSLPIARRE